MFCLFISIAWNYILHKTVINPTYFCRYTGTDGTQSTDTDKQCQAESILQQLHEQAELRRHQQEPLGKRRRKSSDTDGKVF